MFSVPAAIRRVSAGNPPVFTGNIADITVDEGTPNWSRDVSGEWTGTVTSYSLTGEPSWLTIDVNGVLHGTPVGADSATGVIATATNADGSADSNQFDVTAIVLQPPVWTSDIIIPAQEVDSVFSYDTSVHVTGATSYQLQSDPSGLFQVDGGTGVLSTIAATLPSTPVTISGLQIRAINADGNSSSNVFGFEVEAAAGNPDAFIYTWETTADNVELEVPTYFQGTYDAHIVWGDGFESDITADNQASGKHIYATAGTYQVTITGTFTAIRFYSNFTSRDALRTVEQLGDLGCTELVEAFRQTRGVTSFNASPCDTSLVTNISSMLRSWNQAFTLLDISGMTTPLVTNMSNAFNFSNTGSDTASVVATFDISSLTTASSMYNGSNLTTADYDAILIAWAAQAPSINSGVAFHAGAAKYSAGAAADARLVLTDTYLWNITDGGPV